MALHCHAGASATHVPRLLADGVGAGSQRDRHGHRRGGKGSGRQPPVPGEGVARKRALCRGLGCSVWLPVAPFLCIARVFSSHFHVGGFRFPKIICWLPFSSTFSLFSPCIAMNKKLTQKEPVHFCVPDNTIHSLCPGTLRPGLLWVNQHLLQPQPWPADVRHAGRRRRPALWGL